MSATASPADHETLFRQEAREGFDDDVTTIASDKEKEELLVSIQSFSFKFLKDATYQAPTQFASVQSGLDVLWYMFLGTSKALGEDSVYQEKLITLLLWMKNFVELHKSLHMDKASPVKWESYGFSQALQTAWEDLVQAGSTSQQCSLAAFSSKILASGICLTPTALTALWYLREALEHEDEKSLSLLPAAVIWVENAQHALLTFSIWGELPPEHSGSPSYVPGALAQARGVHKPGFTVERFLFWRKRFQELAQHENPAIASDAKKGFMSMINCGRDLDYDVPGEALFAERLQAAMEQALIESGKESVEGDEIDINVNWVD